MQTACIKQKKCPTTRAGRGEEKQTILFSYEFNSHLLRQTDYTTGGLEWGQARLKEYESEKDKGGDE